MACSCDALGISPCRHVAAKPRAAKPGRRTTLPLLAPCKWEGSVTSACTTCGDQERNHERQCTHPADDAPDICTRGNEKSTLTRCNACTLYEGPAAAIQPTRIDALPPARRTVVNLPGHFNAGMTEFNGQLLLASRKTLTSGRGESTIHLSVLGDDFQPIRTCPIYLHHPAALNSQEDPRLFVHRGRLHVAFTGTHTDGRKKSSFRVSQLYAELDDEYRPGKIHAPKYGGPTEKNWSFFSRGHRLFAVYSIKPHRVIEIEGDQVVAVHETPNELPWSGGVLRGGSPPAFAGDRFTSWFHGCVGERGRVYNVGVYEFEPESPFRIIRQTSDPLLWARENEVQPPLLGDARVVFVCGAVPRGDQWLVSAGVGDQRVEILEWGASSASAAAADASD